MLVAGRVLSERYEIIEQIGSGGMSSIYSAREIALDRIVAVKVLSVVLADHSDSRARFEREARIIANLQHPHIVPIHSYGIDENVPYLVMPFLKAGTLEDWMDQLESYPSLESVLSLAEKLASALQYAHDRGIIHRDIKFSNVLFDDSKSPYLSDFGIAKLLGATQLTQTNTLMGTPAFMAPEVWKDEVISPAVDQYALAIMIYHLLAQQPPFDLPQTHGLMYQHLEQAPAPLGQFRQDIPLGLERVLEKAMSKAAQNRYLSVLAFVEALVRADGEQTMSLPQSNGLPQTKIFTMPSEIVSSSQKVLAKPQSQKWLIGGMLVFLLLALLMIGSNFFSASSPEATAEPQLLTNGRGLTNGASLGPGEMQIEYYCVNQGYNSSYTDTDWYCAESGRIVFTLSQSDFDQICRETYEEPEAFALQNGSNARPAFQWRCYVNQ